MKNPLVIILLALSIIISQACKKDEPKKSDEKEIISFTIEGQTGTTIINSEGATIAIAVPDTFNLTSVVPTISISEKASINPASGVAADFSQGPVIYTVTAEDNTTKEWEVTISNLLSSEADILSFSLIPSFYQNGETVFDGQDLYIKVLYDSDLSTLKPSITISEHATIVPDSGAVTDFSSGSALYTVTAQDGTEKLWTAHASYAANTATDIVSFSVPGQVGTSSISKPYINFDVDYGTDLSSIAPTIELSFGATIVPASGTAVDFSATGSVQYVVTAEDGVHTQTWTAQAHYPLTPASDTKFQYVGRWDFTNPALPRAWASGAYIMAKFSGTKCQVALIDEVRYGSNYNYIEIVIDALDPLRYRTTGSLSTIDISSYLTAGEHTIMICKTTESEMGYIDFKGLYLESEDALLTPDPLPVRKIEVIGNSIAVGSNLDISESPCSDDPSPWFVNHNAYFSYGAITARNLNAQLHIAAKSGIGLILSCCDMNYQMPDIYGKTQVENVGSDWDFTQYIPDVVTISLGQNDGIQDSTTFCSAYVAFINQIRTNYPDATLILLNSPMGDNSLNTVLVEYTEAVAAYMNGQGDAKVVAFELSHNFNSGCGYHPDMAQHETIATELTGFIETTMGW